jgi:NAD(P)-dependent dehydrogenase (short-subunit alcohol dehydrogenase family)
MLRKIISITPTRRVWRQEPRQPAPAGGCFRKAEKIAKVVMFLASDESSFITRQLLPVDVGNTARQVRDA